MSLTAARAGVRKLWPNWTGEIAVLSENDGRLIGRPSQAPRPVVVKTWPESQRTKALAQMTRQKDLADAFCDGPFRVPAVLMSDEALLAMVMQDAGDMDLATALLKADAQEARRLLEAAGGWIAVLHGLSRRDAPFRPIGHLNWLDKLVAQAEAGTRRIDDLPDFKTHVAALHGMFDTVRRLPSVRAVTHKDLNTGNLLVRGDRLYGIDFENSGEDEAVRDLFSLGLDALCFAPFGDDPRRAFAALRRGYGADLGDSLVRLILQRAFALGYWARTPMPHSRRQSVRVDGARWVLGQDSAVL